MKYYDPCLPTAEQSSFIASNIFKNFYIRYVIYSIHLDLQSFNFPRNSS